MQDSETLDSTFSAFTYLGKVDVIRHALFEVVTGGQVGLSVVEDVSKPPEPTYKGKEGVKEGGGRK